MSGTSPLHGPRNDPPPSLSGLGKTCDASAQLRKSKGLVVLKTRVVLQPWDGVEEIERVLADANQSVKKGPRGEVVSSSPRRNPALELRDEVLSGEQAVTEFLGHMSLSMPAVATAPAVRAASAAAQASRMRGGGTPSAASRMTPTLEASEYESAVARSLQADLSRQDRSPAGLTASPQSFKHRHAAKERVPSASFLAPSRPPPGQELQNRAPGVGQYTPKFKVVERIGSAAGMSRSDRDIFGLMAQTRHEQSASLSVESSPPAQSPPASPTAVKNPTVERTAGTPAFRSQSARFRDLYRIPTSLESSFGPQGDIIAARIKMESLPPREEPSTYGRGKFSRLPRETMIGAKGADGPDSLSFHEEKRNLKHLVPMSKVISRDRHFNPLAKDGCAPNNPQVLRTNPTGVLSNHPRPHTPICFSHQRGRSEGIAGQTDAQQQCQRESLHIVTNTMGHEHVRGFISIDRMLPHDPSEGLLLGAPSEVEAAANRQPLEVRDEIVSRRSLSATIKPRHHHSCSLISKDESTPGPLRFDDSIVRRRSPTVMMARTDRTAPIFRMGRSSAPANADYKNTELPPRVKSPAISLQVSRDKREARYARKWRGTDTIYDLPVPSGKQIVAFGLLRGRK